MNGQWTLTCVHLNPFHSLLVQRMIRVNQRIVSERGLDEKSVIALDDFEPALGRSMSNRSTRQFCSPFKPYVCVAIVTRHCLRGHGGQRSRVAFQLRWSFAVGLPYRVSVVQC